VIVVEATKLVTSGVASHQFFLGKNFCRGAKCVISGEQQYFVWATAAQSTK